MGLLLLMGGSDYNVRSELFSQNEQGTYLDPAISESARTWRRNLLGYTEDFSNSYWFKNGCTATAGKLTENSATSAHIVGLSALITVPAGTPITYSVEVKAAERSWAVIVFTGGSTTGKYVNLSNGTFGGNFTVAPDTQSITDMGGGWWRVTITRTSSTTSSVDCRIYISTGDGVTSYLGDGASGILVRKAQFELGSSATTYQPITDFSTEFKAAFPTHTIYQDSNGVAPVTAPGDLVGLVLDQRQGALSNLGAELTTNGGFDSDTWWTKSTNVTITGGVCQYSSVALNNGVFRSGVVTAGKFYKIEFTVSGFSSGGVRVYLGGTRTTAVSANGTYTYVMPAGSSDTQIIFEATSAGTILALDNVSVREVPGNHAYQSTSGARPTLGRVPFGGRRNLLTWSEQFDNGAWTKTGVTVTANQVADPQTGEMIGDAIFEVAAASVPRIAFSTTQTGQVTGSFRIKGNGRDQIRVVVDASGALSAYYTLTGSGTVTPASGSFTGTITALGDGWYYCTFTTTSAGGAAPYIATASGGSTIASGDNTKGFWLSRVQYELGSSATTYQRVGSTHDVTEAGQPDCWYLDTSSSKWMQTNAIDFNTWTQDTRRNLLTETESFGASAWIKNRQTVTENAAADDLGNTIADKLIETAVSDTHFCGQNITVTSGQPYTLSVYAKAAERSFIAMGDGGGSARTATFNLTTGAVTNVGAAISNPTATDMGNGWWRCSVTYTPSVTTFAAGIGTRTTDGAFFETYLGDGTSGVLLTKAQLELGTLTTYQPTGTDEMTVIAGVRKLSDAASALVAELSASVSANNGAFWLAAPTTAAADFGFRSKGTAMADCDLANVYAAPRTDVLTGLGDISSDTCALRLNGTAFSVATDQGSGNFGNHILYIGSRAGTSAFFNGHLFHLIIRGKTTEGSKLTGAERLTARKTGITI